MIDRDDKYPLINLKLCEIQKGCTRQSLCAQSKMGHALRCKAEKQQAFWDHGLQPLEAKALTELFSSGDSNLKEIKMAPLLPRID